MPCFGILVIGNTGTGKSTLVNNLLGTDSAGVHRGLRSEIFIEPPCMRWK